MEKLQWEIPKRQDSTIQKLPENNDNFVVEYDEDYSKRLRCGLSKNETIPSFQDYKPGLQTTKNGKLDASRLLEHTKRWSESNSGWLTIIGGVGVGKTHLLKSAIWNAKNGFYITAYDFDKRIKEFSNNIGKVDGWVDPDEWLDKLAHAERHIVIDDIGSGYIQKSWTHSRLERFIDIRYREQLPTAIATNLNEKKLEGELGERIASRITDVNYAICIILNYASDIRRIKRKYKQ
jgi:DNA replication protein DnaC